LQIELFGPFKDAIEQFAKVIIIFNDHDADLRGFVHKKLGEVFSTQHPKGI
jgi:hypothetical protein